MASSSKGVDMSPAPRLTTDEYFRAPETLLPQELVYGLVREAPAPASAHHDAVGGCFMALTTHLRDHLTGRVSLSPAIVVLVRDRDLVVQPDVIFISNERLHIVTDRVWGAPDLAIE